MYIFNAIDVHTICQNQLLYSHVWRKHVILIWYHTTYFDAIYFEYVRGFRDTVGGRNCPMDIYSLSNRSLTHPHHPDRPQNPWTSRSESHLLSPRQAIRIRGSPLMHETYLFTTKWIHLQHTFNIHSSESNELIWSKSDIKLIETCT